MKVIDLEEAKANLEQYANECQSSPVVVTVGGKPVLEMIPIRSDDPEFVDEDRVMKYLVVAAKLRVFVLNGIEAVRTGSDDGAVFRNHRGRPVTLRMVPIAMVGGCIETVAIEHLDILLGHHLPEVFVANTTGGITGAGLFRPENSEVDPGCLKHFGDRSCHELITFIKGPHTANPIEHIGVRVF